MLTGVRQLLVEHRVGFPRGLPQGVVLGPGSREVGVNLGAVGEIEGDRPVHLLQAQRGEGLGDALSGLAVEESVDQRIEGHAGPLDAISALVLLDIFVPHGDVSAGAPDSSALRSTIATGHPSHPARDPLLQIRRSAPPALLPAESAPQGGAPAPRKMLQISSDLQQDYRILLQLNESMLQIVEGGLRAPDDLQHSAGYVLQITPVLLQIILDLQHHEVDLQHIISDLLQINGDSHQTSSLGWPVPGIGRDKRDDGSLLRVVLQQK